MNEGSIDGSLSISLSTDKGTDKGTDLFSSIDGSLSIEEKLSSDGGRGIGHVAKSSGSPPGAIGSLELPCATINENVITPVSPKW